MIQCALVRPQALFKLLMGPLPHPDTDICTLRDWGEIKEVERSEEQPSTAPEPFTAQQGLWSVLVCE